MNYGGIFMLVLKNKIKNVGVETEKRSLQAEIAHFFHSVRTAL